MVNNNIQKALSVMNIIDKKILTEEGILEIIPGGKVYQDVVNQVVQYYKNNGIDYDLEDIYEATAVVIAKQYNISTIKHEKGLNKYLTLAEHYQKFKIGAISSVTALALITGGVYTVDAIKDSKYESYGSVLVDVAATKNSLLKLKSKDVAVNKAIDSYIATITAQEQAFNTLYKQCKDSSCKSEVIDKIENYSQNVLPTLVNNGNILAKSIRAMFNIQASISNNPSLNVFQDQLLSFRNNILALNVSQEMLNKTLASFNALNNGIILKSKYTNFLSTFTLPTDSEYLSIFNDLDNLAKTAITNGETAKLNKVIADITKLNTYFNSSLSYIVGNKSGAKSGVKRTLNDNKDINRYYLIVQPVTKNNDVVAAPVKSIESNQYQYSDLFGVGVSKEDYDLIKNEKIKQGVITTNVVFTKPANSMKLTPNSVFHTNDSYILEW